MENETKISASEFLSRLPAEDGGAAAPLPIRHRDRATFIFDEDGKHIATEGTGTWTWATGMSVRDQFAAAALTGMLATMNAATNTRPSAAFAGDAYDYADAMLAERAKPRKPEMTKE